MSTAPLDPYRYVSKACDVIKGMAEWIYTITRPRLAFVWIGRGWDTKASGSTEHNSGRALDVIIASKVGIYPTAAQRQGGDELAAHLIAHAEQLHIRHIIWYGRIWKRRYASQGWTVLYRPPGANISSLHKDHIHVWLDDEDGSVPTAGLGGAKPGPSAPQPFALANVIRAVNSGKYDGNTAIVQAELNKHYLDHGQGRLKVDGYYGPATKRVYAAWQRFKGWRGSDADGIPGRSTMVALLGPKWKVI